MMAGKEKSWTFGGLKRWKITAVLETQTSLHIGSGEVIEKKVNDSQGKERPVQVNAIIRGKNDKPIIPGSTIKGKLRSLFASCSGDGRLDRVFGRKHDSDKEQGRGGLAEFHDCHLKGDETASTTIEVSTAIDYHTKTAADATLHYSEWVPPGTQFQLTVTGAMEDKDAALVIAALQAFDSNTNPIYLGAEEANGKGRMGLFGNIEVCCLNHNDIIAWVSQGSDAEMASDKFRPLGKEEVTALAESLDSSPITAGVQRQHFDIELKFAGPFLVNDPSKYKQEGDDQHAVHHPLTDSSGNPILPARSFRGAIRAQAERIIRTMGGRCCDTKTPCRDSNNPCIACQMFGMTGWKTTLNISDFTYNGESRPPITQQFVAIDRFHGGGKDGALFSIRHFERPVLKGSVSLELRGQNDAELSWCKGLLALLFRDLQEGDITFGYGANKGYGSVEEVNITSQGNIESEDIEEFRAKCRSSQEGYSCLPVNTPDQSETADKSELPTISPRAGENHAFHNPYHFIPIKEPATSEWLEKDKLNAVDLPHSHAYYRSKTGDGESLHHGRITCKLTVETPLFIGGSDEGQSTDSEDKLKENYRLNGDLAIPATSLRGLISSLTEAASNSALRVLDNGLLSYRKTADRPLKKIGMLFKKDEQWRLLQMEGNVANTIKLKNAYTNQAMIDFLQGKYSWSPKHNVVYYFPKNFSRDDVPSETYLNGMVCGILRILGRGNDDDRKDELENKKHELFIRIDEQYVDEKTNTFDYLKYIQDREGHSVPVPPQVVERYTELANQRSVLQKNKSELKGDKDCHSTKWHPFHLKGAARQKKGKVCLLPLREYDLVYFESDNSHQVTEIAFSAIWRGQVMGRVNDFFPRELRSFNRERKRISPAELLFGFVELNDDKSIRDHAQAFAGKVRVGAGVLSPDDCNKQDKELLGEQPIMLKALSSPKLPSPALYFRQKRGDHSYITKPDLNRTTHQAQGRKVYLHALRDEEGSVQKLNARGQPSSGRGASFPWKTIDEGQRPQLKVRVRPLKPGTSFNFHLDFNNLTEWELGLICYALRPGESFRHKLGMGKPIGLGTVKIKITALQTIDRKKRYTTDDIRKERFNGSKWKWSGQEEATLDPDKLRESFVAGMDDDIYRAIELLGNPENIKYPVHYPQVRNKGIEEENFKWFVANDSGSGDKKKGTEIDAKKKPMKSINQNSTTIPILERYEWNGD